MPKHIPKVPRQLWKKQVSVCSSELSSTCSSYMIIIYDDHLRSSYMIIIYDDAIGDMRDWGIYVLIGKTISRLDGFHRWMYMFDIKFGKNWPEWMEHLDSPQMLLFFLEKQMFGVCLKRLTVCLTCISFKLWLLVSETNIKHMWTNTYETYVKTKF